LHQCEKSDPYPDEHQSKKRDPYPHHYEADTQPCLLYEGGAGSRKNEGISTQTLDSLVFFFLEPLDNLEQYHYQKVIKEKEQGTY
jgi:hypothetical protein